MEQPGTAADNPDSVVGRPGHHGLWWWLKVLEVRLRFLILVVAVLAIVTQWGRLRGLAGSLGHAWRGEFPPPAVSSDAEFFCPMDPGVISAWPAVCPICNMDLVRRKKQDAQLLPEGVVARMQFSPYRIQLAGIRTAEVEPRERTPAGPQDAFADAPVPGELDTAVVSVPESAVIDRGHQKLVFVESMPGMFDAVRVKLGPRNGDEYPVLEGLKSGQRIAVTGAFLIDAEARLNPSLAVAYFGAGSGQASRDVPKVQVAKSGKAPKLTAEQTEQVRQQGTCPVTDLALDSMGGPVPITVEGQTVFICCPGCEPKLRGDPLTYLRKLGRK